MQKNICIAFLIDAISYLPVHYLSGYSYTESFTKMLAILKDEYCLSSWKQIDYDALLSE